MENIEVENQDWDTERLISLAADKGKWTYGTWDSDADEEKLIDLQFVTKVFNNIDEELRLSDEINIKYVPEEIKDQYCEEYGELSDDEILEKFEEDYYGWLIEFNILPIMDQISNEVKEECLSGCEMPVEDCTLMDINMYMGLGVPIEIRSVNPDDFELENLKRINGLPAVIPIKGGFLMHQDYSLEDLVNDYVKPRTSAIMLMIGFYLDKQTRGIGTTGWDELNEFVKNINPVNAILEKYRFQ